MMSSVVAAALRRLQGIANLELDETESALARASGDFGHISQGRALAVIRPASTRSLPEIIAIAREHGAKLTLRGKGLSQSGQAVADQSILVDLSRCDAVSTPDVTKQT